MKLFGKTDIGLVRETNQDAFSFGSFDDGNCWAVVCDGMGGVSGGQVASEICVEKVSEAIKRSYRKGITLSSAKNLLTTAINAANSAVFKEAQENIELKGMGTTVVAVLVLGSIAVVAHVGDSRAYLINDEINQITKDHSFVMEMVRMGKLTLEEAKVHPKRNVITKAIGIEKIMPADTFIETLNKDSIILVCSDGLTAMVDDKEIEKVLRKRTGLDRKADLLVELANKNGGNDNISVILADRRVDK